MVGQYGLTVQNIDMKLYAYMRFYMYMCLHTYIDIHTYIKTNSYAHHLELSFPTNSILFIQGNKTSFCFWVLKKNRDHSRHHEKFLPDYWSTSDTIYKAVNFSFYIYFIKFYFYHVMVFLHQLVPLASHSRMKSWRL